jgi:cbb3-type cytochrome oxidase subunit 3
MRLTDIMSNAGLGAYAQIAMILFMLAFGAIVIRLFLPSRKATFDRASRLPLDDGRAGGSATQKERDA